MKTILLLLLLVPFHFTNETPGLDRNEAKNAFLLLNKIRTNPAKYKNEFQRFETVKQIAALIWNDTLARVAEAKALDMAQRNYFGHVDPDGFGINYYVQKAGYQLRSEWLKNPKANYFESCNAGGLTGEESIKMLIIDEGWPELNHRKHLLGLDNYSASLKDIGIGFARGTEQNMYKTYTCIIIAKHN